MKLEQHWYRLAAEAGFAPAQFELAVQLFDSDRKSAEGVFWLRAAAVQGDEDAYGNLEVYSKLCMSCHAHVANSQRCGACKSAFCCGGECQKAHWQAHKQECKKVRILEKKISESQLHQRSMASLCRDNAVAKTGGQILYTSPSMAPDGR